MTVLAQIQDAESQFTKALEKVFEERAAEFPETARARLKDLWMEGAHHGHNLRLTEEIIQAIKTGRFDTNTGVFELNTDNENLQTHE